MTLVGDTLYVHHKSEACTLAVCHVETKDSIQHFLRRSPLLTSSVQQQACYKSLSTDTLTTEMGCVDLLAHCNVIHKVRSKSAQYVQQTQELGLCQVPLLSALLCTTSAAHLHSVAHSTVDDSIRSKPAQYERSPCSLPCCMQQKRYIINSTFHCFGQRFTNMTSTHHHHHHCMMDSTERSKPGQCWQSSSSAWPAPHCAPQSSHSDSDFRSSAAQSQSNAVPLPTPPADHDAD